MTTPRPSGKKPTKLWTKKRINGFVQPRRALRQIPVLNGLFYLLAFGFILFGALPEAHAVDSPTFQLNVQGVNGLEDYGIAIQLVFFMTLITLAPSIMMLMTSFTRIVIVLGFVRSALGVHQAPSNQIIIGLSLFLTVFLMGPIWDKIYDESIAPYKAQEITSQEAFTRSGTHLKNFMLKQTRSKDLEFFLELSRSPVVASEELPMRVVIPSFVLSELRTAFQMGFMIFVPFLVIDFLVASTLMSMGMMMMPPAIISLPFKLLLFVLVDGWYLVIQSLVESFSG